MIKITEAFKIPLSFNLDAKSQRFVDDLKKSTSGFADKARGSVGGISTKGAAGAGAIAGVAAGLTGGVLVVLEKILKSFDNLVNLASVVIKVLTEFLRPIVDVVVLLLMPILQILRPILQIVRQIMQPFRKIAFDLSREGANALREGDTTKASALFGLSVSEALLGLQAVTAFLFAGVLEQITTLSGEILKLVTVILATFFQPILEFFGVDVGDAVKSINNFIDTGIKTVNDAVKLALGTTISAAQLQIAVLANQLGVDISDNYKEVNNVLRELFVGTDNSFISTFEDLTSKFENQLIPMGNALDNMVSKFQQTADDINNINVNGKSGGGTSSDGTSFGTKVKNLFFGSDRSDMILLSDINLKENIQEIVNPIEKIQKLKGVTWDWKSLQQQGTTGVIAQDVEKIFPNSIIQKDGIKMVDYSSVIGLLVEVVKSQQEQINKLNKKW